MSIITGICNEKTNELATNAILCQNNTIFKRQELVFFISRAEKIESMQEFVIKKIRVAVSLHLTVM